MSRLSSLVAILAFVVAGVAAYGTALFGARWIEETSVEAVNTALEQNDLGFVEIYADGLQVAMTGTAPSEASRFRAISVAGSVVDSGRLIDAMDVVDAAALAPPKFSLEILRNDAGISLIGLVPAEGGRAALTAGLERYAAQVPITDMVETADYTVPENWDQAVRFALSALDDLPRSKVSVEAARVSIKAVSDSPEDKRRLEAALTRRKPNSVVLALDITAPRPVITPFILRVTKENDVLDFDACSADSKETSDAILSAATAAGFEGKANCVIGLGVPSASWADAARVGIGALGELPGGSLTISDADVTLIASETTAQAEFDRIVGQLKADLPEIFSLSSVLTPRPQAADLEDSAPEFVAIRSPEGIVQMRGRLRNSDQEAAILSFARSHFGVGETYINTRTLEDLPPDWTARVFAAVEALSFMENGAVTVSPETINIRGVTGKQNIRSDLSRILTSKLGQNARFDLDVEYDEELDPRANLPSPQECVERLNSVLAEKKITFAPGSANFDASAEQQLNRLGDAFKDCDIVPMEIGGHTDSQGSEELNRGLSQQRADAVRSALVDRGVPASILSAVGYGEDQPIADNETAEGREANRRIAFTLRTSAAALTEE